MHTEIYKIKGKKYRYEVTNYREGHKVKHKKKYLGPVNPVNKTQRKKSTGRKPSAFVRKPSDEELQALETASKSNNAFAKERAVIILDSAAGVRTSAICKKLGREKRSVLAAIHSFNTTGVACLTKGKTTGPKPRFTEEHKARILQVVNTDPRLLGKTFSSWSLAKLRAQVVSAQIVERISIEKLRQILKEGNKKFKKSRKWLHSNDPEFAKKNCELMS